MTLDYIEELLAIPDHAARMADVASREAREDAGADAHDAIVYQGDYVKELVAETDCPAFDVDGANEAFFEWKHHKAENIMTFRDHAYRSMMTDTMAPLHHTPWKDALGDSVESYPRT